MKKAVRVYLAGAVHSEFDWRRQFLEELAVVAPKLAIDAVDPMDTVVEGKTTLDVVSLDLLAVRRADVVLGYFWYRHFPIGTVCELKEAVDRGVPTFVLFDESLSLQDHLWLRYLATDWCAVPDECPAHGAFYFRRFVERACKVL